MPPVKAPRGPSSRKKSAATKTDSKQKPKAEAPPRGTLSPKPKFLGKKIRPEAKALDTKLTPAQAAALYHLSTFSRGATPAKFAKKAYAKSAGWQSECRTGSGPHGEDVYLVKGGAMNITAGAALAKLFKAGYANRTKDGRAWSYTVSVAGRRAYLADIAKFNAKTPAPKPAKKKGVIKYG